jgi:hypothetical protein
MKTNRYLVAFVLGPVLFFSWVLLAACEANGAAGPLEYLIVGYLIGTMFGQATLAAAWTALGPLPLLWRLPLSLGWIAALAIAFINLVGRGGPSMQVALVIAACLGAQWLLVQVPLWGLAVGYGVWLRHWSDPPQTVQDRQFGIRQVMILTGIVALVLGVCRWIVGETAMYFQSTDWQVVIIFIFLTFAGIVMTLPLLIAGLLPRYSLVAVAVALFWIAVGTWIELPLVMVLPTRGGGPNFWHLALINAFQAAWVLGIVALVRWCGYGIGQPHGENPFASNAQLAAAAAKTGESLPPGQKLSGPVADT